MTTNVDRHWEQYVESLPPDQTEAAATRSVLLRGQRPGRRRYRGAGTLADWRQGYWDYIVSECQRIGRDPARNAPLNMERFRVVYRQPLRAQ
jgi:hypothetical protein